MPRTSRPTATRSPCSAMARARPLGVLERRGAEVDPAAAGGQRPLERLGVADAAAHLDLDVERADDAGQQLGVRPAPEGGVEVDEVQPLGALLLPGQRGLDRVAELAAGAGDALHELHGAALDDVDGGQELQAGRSVRGLAHGWVLRGRGRQGVGCSGGRRGSRLSTRLGFGAQSARRRDAPGHPVPAAGASQARSLAGKIDQSVRVAASAPAARDKIDRHWLEVVREPAAVRGSGPSCAAGPARPRRTSRGGTGSPTAGRSRPPPRTARRGWPR